MAAMTAKAAKMVAERYAKAVELVNEGKVFRLYGEDGLYVVVNGEGVAYQVDIVNGECTCPDSQYRCARLDILCKHALAALIVHERQQAEAGESAPQSQAEPQPDTDDFPAAWCQQCGVALDAGELCDACTEKARALLAELVG